MYKCKYFTLKELLPPELYSLPEWERWLLFDDRILKLDDRVREIYGSCSINSGNLTGCGFRLKKVDAKDFSQHYFGRASDLHIKLIEDQNLNEKDKIKAYDNIRKELRKLPEFKNIRMEWGISWLHIDCGNSDVLDFDIKS
jgi:hypothetical protein